MQFDLKKIAQRNNPIKTFSKKKMNITKHLIFLALVGTNQELYPMGAPEAAAGVASVASVWGAPLKIFLKTITLAQAGV